MNSSRYNFDYLRMFNRDPATLNVTKPESFNDSRYQFDYLRMPPREYYERNQFLVTNQPTCSTVPLNINKNDFERLEEGTLYA